MNQNSLQVFHTLYETLNMHTTARTLFLSQQAVSKTIRSLEEELNVKLFVRTKSGVKPTSAGDVLYREGKKLQGQYAILREKLDAVRSDKKILNMACAYGTMYQVFPAIKAFQAKYPNIEVHWKELPDREVKQRLLNEQVDLTINVKGRANGYLRYLPLYSIAICLLVYEGHPLYDREQIEFKDLDNENMILEGEDFHIYSLFRSFCERADAYPRIVAETSEIGFCQKMAEMKEGLALTVDFIAAQSKLNGVRTLPFADPEFRWEVGLEVPAAGSRKEEADLFEHFIQEYFSADNR